MSSIFTDHRETDRFFLTLGVQLPQSTSGQFHYHRTEFSSQIQSKIGNILVKTASQRILLNIDDTPVGSKSHSPITLTNLSSINLVSIFRCSSPPRQQKKLKKIEKRKCLGVQTPQRMRWLPCLQDCLITLTCHLGLVTSRTRWVRCLWYCNYVSHVSVGEVDLDVPTILTPVFNLWPVVFLLCVLYGTGQQVDQPPSRVSFWPPRGRYTCSGGPLGGLSEISCNHKPWSASPQSLGSGSPGWWRWKRSLVVFVCQRPADQVSFLRWGLICPRQLMVFKKRIRLGTSSSWDSSPVIFVRPKYRVPNGSNYVDISPVDLVILCQLCLLWRDKPRGE